MPEVKEVMKNTATASEPRQTFLETVLSQPLSNGGAQSLKCFEKACPYSPTCAIPGAFDLSNVSSDDSSFPHGESSRGPKAFSFPTLPSLNDFPSASYSIDCNNCGLAVPDEHYHCGICEKGDFDLCKPCVDAGVTCHGEEHWLLKRTIRNGLVIPSTTETLAPKKSTEAAPDSSDDVATPVGPEQDNGERTCNSCICRMSMINTSVWKLLTVLQNCQLETLSLARPVPTLTSASPASKMVNMAMTHPMALNHKRSFITPLMLGSKSSVLPAGASATMPSAMAATRQVL